MNSNFTVLVVDDSESMRQVIIMALRQAGYNAVEAPNGVKALKLAKSQNFNIVLTDINFPIMDGLTLIREIRSLPNYQNIPIIIVTTESSDVQNKKGRKEGATGWIVKPIDQDKLLAAVDKLLH